MEKYYLCTHKKIKPKKIMKKFFIALSVIMSSMYADAQIQTTHTDAPVDTEKLKYAAKMACVDEFIDRLPQKYNTKIGADGIGLSQGQKQRILIARAIYRNPDYIILDEATNSLDASNEHMIVDNLNSFYNGRTVIVVAHRLSTVKDADQIIVLDKGCIIEVGNHKELTSKKGAYYNLVKNQLELGM